MSRRSTKPAADSAHRWAALLAGVSRDRGSEIKREIAVVMGYLESCYRRRDWHGVSDAANDLRVLEERLNNARAS